MKKCVIWILIYNLSLYVKSASNTDLCTQELLNNTGCNYPIGGTDMSRYMASTASKKLFCENSKNIEIPTNEQSQSYLRNCQSQKTNYCTQQPSIAQPKLAPYIMPQLERKQYPVPSNFIQNQQINRLPIQNCNSSQQSQVVPPMWQNTCSPQPTYPVQRCVNGCQYPSIKNTNQCNMNYGFQQENIPGYMGYIPSNSYNQNATNLYPDQYLRYPSISPPQNNYESDYYSANNKRGNSARRDKIWQINLNEESGDEIIVVRPNSKLHNNLMKYIKQQENPASRKKYKTDSDFGYDDEDSDDIETYNRFQNSKIRRGKRYKQKLFDSDDNHRITKKSKPKSKLVEKDSDKKVKDLKDEEKETDEDSLEKKKPKKKISKKRNKSNLQISNAVKTTPKNDLLEDTNNSEE